MKKKSNNRRSNKSTNTRHDGFIKRVLGDPIIAREFIEEYLPYHIQEKLDLSTLNELLRWYFSQNFYISF